MGSGLCGAAVVRSPEGRVTTTGDSDSSGAVTVERAFVKYPKLSVAPTGSASPFAFRSAYGLVQLTSNLGI